MPYCNKTDVKKRIGIKLEDLTHDAEIEDAIAWADAQIDNEFTAIDKTVPATVPQSIKDASADLAAYFYYRNRKPEDATRFLEDGFDAVRRYINAHYFKGAVERVRYEGE